MNNLTKKKKKTKQTIGTDTSRKDVQMANKHKKRY